MNRLTTQHFRSAFAAVSGVLALFCVLYAYINRTAPILGRSSLDQVTAPSPPVTVPSVSHTIRLPTDAELTRSSSVPRLARNQTASTKRVDTSLRLLALRKFIGGLGNEMFQYASILGISRTLNRRLVLPKNKRLNKAFGLNYTEISTWTLIWPVVSQKRYAFFEENLLHLPNENVVVAGFLQSYKYFESIKDEIRQKFVFRLEIASSAERILRQVPAKLAGQLWIGIHVRRGIINNEDMGYVVPGASYFLGAINWMRHTFDNISLLFLVVSDDLSWCRETFTQTDVIVVNDAPGSVHMAVLAKCDHVILSVGTFGWWGAWLAGGQVIYFNKFMQNNSSLSREFSPSDYYPQGWLGMGEH